MSIGLPEEATPLEHPTTPGRAGILVVDEDPAFQLGLKTFLREYVGFDQVFAARSGQEALDLIESEDSIDVITLDYQMPGMNGIEVMEKLSLSAPRPLSVLMITGYPSEDLESEFKSFSSPTLLADYFLSKPVEFEKLEPLVLKAHEELIAARHAAEIEPAVIDEPLPADFSETAGIETSLFRQEAKIDALSEQVRVLRRKSRRDTCLLALLIVGIGAAVHFGWFSKLEEAWGDAKSDWQRIMANPAAPVEPAPSPGSAPEPAVQGEPL